MNPLISARVRLRAAGEVPAILTAAYGAFDQLLLVIREHEQQAEGLFAAFVMAAASAADGRDALTSAPSLPLPLPRPTASSRKPVSLNGQVSIDTVADQLAGLSQVLADRLMLVTRQTPDPRDQAACDEAARSAVTVRALLAGPGR